MFSFSSCGRAVGAAVACISLYLSSAMAAPIVTSIARLQPGPVTTADTLTWRVTFSESVTGVDTSDFTLTQLDGAASGAVSAVEVADSAAEYVVAARDVIGVGTLRLDLNAYGTGIKDGEGNEIARGFSFGQPYTHVHAVALAGWGLNSHGQIVEPKCDRVAIPVMVRANAIMAGKTIVSVKAGNEHTLALDADGKVYAWGMNDRGQLGNGSMSDNPTCEPVGVVMSGVLAGKTVVAIDAGIDYSLLLTSEGKVYAWGYGAYGLLGNGSFVDSSVPVAVDATGALAGVKIVQISAGPLYSLALSSDGRVFGWGQAGFSWILTDMVEYTSVPVLAQSSLSLGGQTIVSISAGGSAGYALTDEGRVYAWGDKRSGGFGDGGPTNWRTRDMVESLVSGVMAGATVKSIDASLHCLALGENGRVSAWGAGSWGQLGVGLRGDSNVPVVPMWSSVDADQQISAISAGMGHSLALSRDGKVLAWGMNLDGEIGDGSVSDGTYASAALTPVPVDVSEASALHRRKAYTVDAGFQNSFAIVSPACIETVTAPVSGVYREGASLRFVLNTSHEVVVGSGAGEVRLGLSIGGLRRYAAYVPNGSRNSLDFVYVVQSGDFDDDGVTLSSASIDLNGVAITDIAGWAIDTALPDFVLPQIIIDTNPPQTSLAATPASLTTSGSAAFVFSGDDASGSGVASFEASLDGGAYAAATSPVSLTGLADGAHTFAVRAVDNAGNKDATPATCTWTIDTTAPETSLSATPAVLSTSANATFGFTGDDASGSGVASFEASLDGAGYATATSPVLLTGLSDGAHTFAVRTVDNAGNKDATPATCTWTVDTIAPGVPTALSAAATSPSAITLSWTASTDAIGVAGYRIYRGGTAIGTSATTSYSDTGLTAATSYTCTVTAYDAAGNESAQSAAATATTQTEGPQSLSVNDTAGLEAALATAAANPSASYTITVPDGTYTPSAGLRVSASNLTLEGRGTISGAGLASGALLTIGGDNVIVSGLTFQAAAGGAIAIISGADNGAIDECTFEGSGITATDCANWTISGNRISDTTAAAFSLTGGAGLALTDNVILDCAPAFVLADSSSPTVRNNFIANNRTSAALASIVLTEVTGAQIDSNSLYQAGSYANAIEYSGSAAVGAIRNNLANKPITATGTATATLATNVTAAQAAWFKDPTAGDMHLAAAPSGVVDAGTRIAGLTVDIDGDARPIGSGYDIGADESQPDTTAPTAPTSLSTVTVATTSVSFNWTASTDSAPAGAAATGVSGYRIYRNGTAVGTSTTTSYSDTGLTAGTAYSYTVTAYDGAANKSAASAVLRFTTTAAPTPGGGTSGGGGGGGGAPGMFFFTALTLLAALRSCFRRE